MSLQVVAVIEAKQGSEDTVREVLAGLVSASLGEEGCLRYELSESAEAPGTFVTQEQWVDRASLDAHMETKHVAAAFATAGEHLVRAPGIHPLTPVALPG